MISKYLTEEFKHCQTMNVSIKNRKPLPNLHLYISIIIIYGHHVSF